MQAIEAVLRADKKRTAALKREKEVLAALDAAEDNDEIAELNSQLEAVYDDLNAMGAERAEARARQILAGPFATSDTGPVALASLNKIVSGL